MTFSTRSPQARRRFIIFSVSALLLAGCGGGPRPRPVSPGAPARYPVALLVPLSGQDSAVGQSIANAARLALVDMNNSSIDLKVYNTAEGGAASAAGLALGEGARLILGPLLSDQVRAVAPIAQKAKVPIIAYSNDASAAGNGVFILGFVPSQSIERVVFHARQNGAVRFGAIAPTGVYGQRSSQSFMTSVGRAGGQLVAVESYSNPDASRSAARRLNARGPNDAVLIADSGRAAAAAASQFRSEVRLLGPDLWSSETRLGATPRLRGAWYAAASDVRFRQLATRYRARFGSTPLRLASLGYDSMLLTISASRNWNPRRRFPIDAITDPEGFVGVDGIFRFGRDGVAQRGLEVRQVTASGTTVVSPAPTSFAR